MGRAQCTSVLIVHVQTLDHAHPRHLLDEISIATNHARAENVTLSQQIGEEAAILASIFA